MEEFEKFPLSCLESLPSVVLPLGSERIGNDICAYELDYWLDETTHPYEYTQEIIDCIKLLWIAGRKDLAVSYLGKANTILSEDYIDYMEEYRMCMYGDENDEDEEEE